MLVARTLRIALTLILVVGGFLFIRNLKQGMLSGIGGDTGLLAGSGGLLAGISGEKGLLKGLNVPAGEAEAWRECPLPHPGGTPALTLLQRTAERREMESQHQVRFGEGADAVRRWLPLEGCGETRMDAYWYPPDDGLGPCIRLRDYLHEYLLDLERRKTYLLLRYEGQVFAGEISENDPGYLTCTSSGPEDEPEIQVYVGGNRAENITHTAAASTPGEYFGGIEGRRSSLRFVPASESDKSRRPGHDPA